MNKFLTIIFAGVLFISSVGFANASSTGSKSLTPKERMKLIRKFRLEHGSVTKTTKTPVIDDSFNKF